MTLSDCGLGQKKIPLKIFLLWHDLPNLCSHAIFIPLWYLFPTKQAQESLAAAMSLSDISGIVTSWAHCYKNSTPIFNFSLILGTKNLVKIGTQQEQAQVSLEAAMN